MSNKKTRCQCLICTKKLSEDILQYDADIAAFACREHIENYDGDSMYLQTGIGGNTIHSGRELKDGRHCYYCNNTGIYSEQIYDEPYELKTVCSCLYEPAVHVIPVSPQTNEL